jgi:glyoxylate reductase
MARILVTRVLPEGSLDALSDHEVVGPPVDDCPMTQAELVAAASDVDAILCLLTDAIDFQVLEAGLPRLKVVANIAVGYDNIDVEAARRLGIAVCNTPAVLDETTADTAFHLILAASRLTSSAEADLRSGRWPGWGINQYLGRDVQGATLGIVGYGRIGQAVARRARGFEMRVLHHARRDTGKPGYVAEIDELLPQVDILSLHVPGGASTHHLIDERRLGLLPEHAVLVNTARGPVVDEAALAAALENGSLFAAGLDVYEKEPEIHPRLLSAPRTVLLPHVGSASRATRTRMAQLAAEGAAAVLAGRSPPNLV